MLDRRGDEGREERVRLVRLGLEFGMALHPEEPRVVFQLDDLDQAALGIPATDRHAGLLEARHVVVVDLKAVAVALGDDLLAVCLPRERAGLEFALVGAEAHRAALEDDMALFVHQRDDRMRGGHVEFHGVGVFEPEHIARVVNDRDLHAEAEAEIGDFLFAGETGGGDLALDPTVAKATGHQNAVEQLQPGEAGLGLQVLGIDADDFHPGLVGDAGMTE